MPLDQFIERSGLEQFMDDIKNLKHTGIFVVGLGFMKRCPSNKCWIYFPDNNSPFYRVTYFSNYSPNNVPGSGYYSLMVETAYSEYEKKSKNTIIEEIIQGMINSRLISEKDKDKIVTTYLIDVPYAYPVPTLKRDEILEKIQSFLMTHNVYSRGRFGAWKYEIGNMDHSVMQGIEVVNRILKNEKEETWRF